MSSNEHSPSPPPSPGLLPFRSRSFGSLLNTGITGAPLQTPRERFASRVAREVERKLVEAQAASGRARGFLLQSLFNDITSSVEETVQDQLDGLPPYYYIILSQHYMDNPADADALHPVCASLWSNVLFPSLYALLMHQWLLCTPQAGTASRFNVFLKGANRLFWVDVDEDTKKYNHIFQTVSQELVLDTFGRDRPERAWKDLTSLVAKFYFYYAVASSLPSYIADLKEVKKARMAERAMADGMESEGSVGWEWGSEASDVSAGSSSPNVMRRSSWSGPIRVGAPAVRRKTRQTAPQPLDELFVDEAIRQVTVIKNEQVLADYLSHFTVFSSLDLSPVMRNRLQGVLYTFTAPGGPFFLSRSVRHAAYDVMDTLFPEGRYARKAINLLCRLFHPYYLPSSFANWVSEFIARLLIHFLGPIYKIVAPSTGDHTETPAPPPRQGICSLAWWALSSVVRLLPGMRARQ